MKNFFSAETIHKIETTLARLSLLVFVLWAFFLSFEYLAYGANSYVKIHDNADVTLALKLTHGAAHGDSAAGLWDPQQIGGTDAFTEVGSLDSLNFLFDIFPGWLAYGLFMFLQRFIAGYFTFRLLTEQFDVNPILATPSALLYSAFAHNEINLQYQGYTSYDSLGLPGVPLVLYCTMLLSKSASKNNFLPFLLAGLFGAAYASVSFFAYTVFFFPLLFVWLIFFSEHKKTALITGCAFLAGWLIIEFLEFGAVINFAGFSQRTIRSYCPPNGFNHLYWIDITYKQFFNTTNLLPALAGALAVFLPQKNAVYKTTIFILVLCILFFYVGTLITLILCSGLVSVPLLSGFNLSRFYLYFPFLVAILAGVGLQSIFLWFRTTRKMLLGFLLPYAICFSLLVNIFIIESQVKVKTEFERESGSNFADIYENPYLEYLSSKISETDPRARAVMLFAPSYSQVSHPGFLWPYNIRTLDGYANLYTIRFRDYWKAVIDPMMQTYPTCRFGLRLDLGETRLYLSNACDVTEEVDPTKPGELYNFDLLSLGSVRYIVSTYEIEDSTLIEIDTSSISCDEMRLTCKRYFLYENPNAVPFLSVRSVVRSFPSDKKLINRLKQAEIGT